MNKTRRFALAMLSMGIGIMLVIGVGIVPGVKRILEQRKENIEQENRIRKLTTKSSLLASMDEQELNAQLRTALSGMPLVTPYQQSLLGFFSLLSRYSLGVSNFKVSTVNVQGKTLAQVVASVSGDYGALKAFLVDFNSVTPLTTVESVKLSRPTGATQSFIADLSMVTHSSPAPTTIGNPGDPLPVVSSDLDDILRSLQGFQSFQPQTSVAPGSFPSAESLFGE